MYLPSSRDRMYAIPPLQDPRHLFPSFATPQAEAPFLQLLFLPHGKPPLKLMSFSSAEVVAAPNHVGSVRVVGRVERSKQGEHFRRVPAAAEDDEEVRWCAAFAGRGTAAVEGGEDVDETELWGVIS